MNKYHKLDEIGRKKVMKKLNEYFDCQFKEYEGDYDAIDLDITATTEGKEYVYTTEIKYRPTYKSTDFDSLMIEEKKYNILNRINDMYGRQVRYLMYFGGDDKLISVDVTKCKVNWKEFKRKKNTFESDEINSLCGFIPMSQKNCIIVI